MDEQRRYVLEQLERALGEEWLRQNEHLVRTYWDAIVALGYALPDEQG